MKTDRRHFVSRGCRMFAACLAVPLWNLLGGCKTGGKSAETGPLKLEIAELPLNRRVRFEHDGRALEVIRTTEGVTARSLLCTHQGCYVRWVEKDQIYLCPCHDGRFNDRGEPVYGPPREALREIPVVLTATEAVIDG